jgi:hypothetical protein
VVSRRPEAPGEDTEAALPRLGPARRAAGIVGERLALGVVLYDGDVAVPFGERLWAAPMACLFGN